MNEPTDKPFHDWVRRTLYTYRPAYDPHDWRRMQRTLRRRRWWRRAGVGGAGLLALALIGWLTWPTAKPDTVRDGIQPGLSPERPAPADPRVLSEANPPAGRRSKLAVTADRPARRLPVGVVKPEVRKAASPANIAQLPVHHQFPYLPTNVRALIGPLSAVAFSPEETAIQQQMLTGDFGPDSTAYQTLSRNLRRWPDAVVVCDLTSSMFPYSTQLFAWFRQNARTTTIKGVGFFTDCDSLGNETRPGGPPGQLFVTTERDPARVLPTMLRAARNTVRNEDDAENDVEALLTAQDRFPQARHLILLADNLSAVKDMARLRGVNRPVHVILCGTTGGYLERPFQADYENIARQTGGTLHTLEDDLNPAAFSGKTVVRVGPNYYRYLARKGRFKRVSFSHRPTRLLGFLWF